MMKAKNNNTSARVKINTGLIVLLAIIFAAMTFCGVKQLSNYQKNLFKVSDAPGLCYDDELWAKQGVIQNAYPCSTEYDEDGNPLPATSENDYAMFLFDRVTFAGYIVSSENTILLTIMGSMLTIGTLVGAVVYWNHNRK